MNLESKYYGFLLACCLLFTACSEVMVVGFESESECTYANNLKQCLKNIEDPNSLNWVSEFDWGDLNESLNDTVFTQSVSVLPNGSFRLDVQNLKSKIAILIRSNELIQLDVLKDTIEYNLSLLNTPYEGEYISTLVLDLDEVEYFQVKALSAKTDLNLSMNILKKKSADWRLSDSYLSYVWDIASVQKLAPNAGYWSSSFSLLEGDRIDLSNLPQFGRVKILPADIIEIGDSTNSIFDSAKDSKVELETPIAGEYVVMVENESSKEIDIDQFSLFVQRTP